MYLFTIVLVLVVRLIIWWPGKINWRALKLNFFNRRIAGITGLFENNFINAKAWFVTKFNALPNIGLIKDIDTCKAYALIMANFENEITAVYQYNTFVYNENSALFIITIFVLKNKRIIQLGYDYAEILYTGRHYKWTNDLLGDLANFRITGRTKVVGFANAEVMN